MRWLSDQAPCTFDCRCLSSDLQAGTSTHYILAHANICTHKIPLEGAHTLSHTHISTNTDTNANSFTRTQAHSSTSAHTTQHKHTHTHQNPPPPLRIILLQTTPNPILNPTAQPTSQWSSQSPSLQPPPSLFPPRPSLPPAGFHCAVGAGTTDRTTPPSAPPPSVPSSTCVSRAPPPPLSVLNIPPGRGERAASKHGESASRPISLTARGGPTRIPQRIRAPVLSCGVPGRASDLGARILTASRGALPTYQCHGAILLTSWLSACDRTMFSDPLPNYQHLGVRFQPAGLPAPISYSKNILSSFPVNSLGVYNLFTFYTIDRRGT